jgi:O-methyltransferase
MIKGMGKDLVRVLAPPIVRNIPIRRWPGWLGRTLDVKVPHSIIPKKELSPSGQANINILIAMIERTRDRAGDIADVGVFRGASTLGMALYLREQKIDKKIYAFDSFEGFPEEADADSYLGGAQSEDRTPHGFSKTSVDLVRHKLDSFLLQNVEIVEGYFCDSFPRFAPRAIRFSFVHLDVNLYDSYRQALEFFYPRTVPGGVVMFDEYNDPPWPGCKLAVDEFIAGKPVELSLAQADNYQKWFLTKQ